MTHDQLQHLWEIIINNLIPCTQPRPLNIQCIDIGNVEFFQCRYLHYKYLGSVG